MAYKDKATKGSNPSETKVWVNPWQVVGTTETLAKGKRNLDGAAAEGNDKYQLEVQIQTTPRDHFSPIRWVYILQTMNFLGEAMRKRHTHTLLGGVQNGTAPVEGIWQCLAKWHRRLPISRNLFQVYTGNNLNWHWHMTAHCSTVCVSKRPRGTLSRELYFFVVALGKGLISGKNAGWFICFWLMCTECLLCAW